MRIIDNMLLVSTNDEEKHELLINTLTGKINVVSADEAKCIRRLKVGEFSNLDSRLEKRLINDMLKAGLIMSASEEEKLVAQILSECRQRHNLVMNQNQITVFVLTYMCNFACPYCYEYAPLNQDCKVMTKEMVDRVFEINAGTLNQIALYGGEPLLPETRKIVEYIVSKAPLAEYSVTTNGYHLVDFIDILSNLKVQYVMVTLDGPEEAHDLTRMLKGGGRTYARIIQGIKMCLNHLVPIRIRMNISEENVSSCEKLREMLINEFGSQFDSGLLTFELQPLFQLSFDNRNKLNDRLVYNKVADEGTPLRYNTIMHTVSPILSPFLNNERRKFVPRYCNCDAEGKRRFYDVNGDIYSCILSLNNKAAVVGTFYPEFKFKENSILTRNVEEIAECRACKLKFLCGGGCANGIIATDGDVMKPNCHQTMYEIYYELPRLFRKYTNDGN